MLRSDAAVAEFWDYYSSTLPPEFYFSNHSGTFIAAALDRFLPAGARILDFGCGPDFLIGNLLGSPQGYRVNGMDFSATSVDKINALHSARPGFGGATCGREFPLPLSSGEFDAVIALEVIEHL